MGSLLPDKDHQILRFGQFRLDVAQRTVFSSSGKVKIGDRAFDILRLLVSRPGELITKSEFSASIWPDRVVEDVNLRVHIAALRRELSRHDPTFSAIKSVSGQGYVFAVQLSGRSSTRAVSEPSVYPEASKAITHPSPRPFTSKLIGREKDVQAIVSLLTQHRFVTVTGPGGVGKTTAALAAIAAYCRSNETSGLMFHNIELSSLNASELVPSAFAATLNVACLDKVLLDAVLEDLKGKQVIMLVDNCEHIIDGAALTAEAICDSESDVRVLATSREPLRAQNEWTYRLEPLTVPGLVKYSTREAFSFPSVELFFERARATLASFQIHEGNVAAICDICRKLDGLPLAIELAAARVETSDVSGLLQMLDDRLRVLTWGRRTAPPRQRTLRATLDWSHATLSPDEQIALRRVGVFRGVFDARQAASVFIDIRWPESRVRDSLSGLVSKSLIVAALSPGGTLYHLLDSTRAYAQDRLCATDELNRIARLHARFYLMLYTEPAGTYVEQCRDIDPLGKELRILDDVRSALDWTFGEGGDVDLGMQLTWASVPLWTRIGLLSEYRMRINRALTFIESADASPDVAFRLTLAHAQTDFLTKAMSDAVAPKSFYAALALAQKHAGEERQMNVLYGAVVMEANAGDYGKGAELVKQLKPLVLRHPEEWPLYHRLHAMIDMYSGNFRRGHKHADLALRIDAAMSRTARPAPPFRYNLKTTVGAVKSRLLWLRGQVDDAASLAAESVEYAEQLEDPLSLCICLCLGALPVFCLRGDHSQLASYLRQLDELTVASFLGNWRGHMLYNLAFSAGTANRTVDLRQFDGNVPYYHEVIAAADHTLLTNLVVQRTLSGQGGWIAAEVYRGLGDRQLAGDNLDATKSYLLKALTTARRQDGFSWELRAATSYARHQRDFGDISAGREVLSDAYNRVTQGFSTQDVRRAKELLEEIS